jgi:stringent starvation protein B
MAAEQDFEPTSTRPYLVRALHEWCCDNGFTPYITVFVDPSVQVPLEYVKDGEIVLNIGLNATTALRLGNDYLEFKARFSGAVREIMVPMDHVLAIFSRESGQGMAFPKPEGVSVGTSKDEPGQPRAVISLAKSVTTTAGAGPVDERVDSLVPQSDNTPVVKPRPALKRVK